MKSDIRPCAIDISIKLKNSKNQLLPPLRYGNIKQARFRGIDIAPGVKPIVGGIKFVCRVGRSFTGGSDVVLVIYSNDIYLFRCAKESVWTYRSHLHLPHPVLSCCEGPGYVVLGCSMNLVLLRVEDSYRLGMVIIPCGRNSFSSVYTDQSNRVIAVAYSGELFVWDVNKDDLSTTLVVSCNLGVRASRSFACVRIAKTGIHRGYLVSEDYHVHVYDILYETVVERHLLDHLAEAVEVVDTGGAFYILVYQPGNNILMLDRLGSIRDKVVFATRARMRSGVRSFRVQCVAKDMFVLVVLCKKGFIAPFFVYKGARIVEAMSFTKEVVGHSVVCYKANDDVNMVVAEGDSLSLHKYSFYLKPERLAMLVSFALPSHGNVKGGKKEEGRGDLVLGTEGQAVDSCDGSGGSGGLLMLGRGLEETTSVCMERSTYDCFYSGDDGGDNDSDDRGDNVGGCVVSPAEDSMTSFGRSSGSISSIMTPGPQHAQLLLGLNLSKRI